MTETHETASCSVIPCTAIPEDMREASRELVKLYVPVEDRRKGYGTALLTRICKEADEANMTLILLVQPYGDPDLSKSQLKDWYRRFGFIEIQEDIAMMARMPGCTPRVLQ